MRDVSELLTRWKAGNGHQARTGEQKRHLLEGLRVLDFSNVLAGPASTRTMAEYGAEVIKIDTTDPLFGPRWSYPASVESLRLVYQACDRCSFS